MLATHSNSIPIVVSINSIRCLPSFILFYYYYYYYYYFSMRKFDWPITPKEKTIKAPQIEGSILKYRVPPPLGTLICQELGNSLLWHPHPFLQILIKKTSMESPLSKWTVNSRQSTHKKKKEWPLHTIMQLFIGCMEILFLKLAANYFWPRLIALPKNTQPIQSSIIN